MAEEHDDEADANPTSGASRFRYTRDGLRAHLDAMTPDERAASMRPAFDAISSLRESFKLPDQVKSTLDPSKFAVPAIEPFKGPEWDDGQSPYELALARSRAAEETAKLMQETREDAAQAQHSAKMSARHAMITGYGSLVIALVALAVAIFRP
jgi:hypothetical protein